MKSEDADLTLLLIDSRAGATAEVERIAGELGGRKQRVWLVLNKVDLIQRHELLPLFLGIRRSATAFEGRVGELTGTPTSC